MPRVDVPRPSPAARKRWRRRLTAPTVQVAGAVALMLGGAWLIAIWMFGLVMIFGGILFAADALLRQTKDPDEGDLSSHQAILRRYERSP